MAHPVLQFVAAFSGKPTCRMELGGAMFTCHVGHTLHKLFNISVSNTSRLSKDAYDAARAGLNVGVSASPSAGGDTCHSA